MVYLTPEFILTIIGTDTNYSAKEIGDNISLKIRKNARILDDAQVKEMYLRYGLIYYEGADPNEYKLVCYLEAADRMIE